MLFYGFAYFSERYIDTNFWDSAYFVWDKMLFVLIGGFGVGKAWRIFFYYSIARLIWELAYFFTQSKMSDTVYSWIILGWFLTTAIIYYQVKLKKDAN